MADLVLDNSVVESLENVEAERFLALVLREPSVEDLSRVATRNCEENAEG